MYASMGLALMIAIAQGTAGFAQSRPSGNARRAPSSDCVHRTRRLESDLPIASRTARDRLIANPARIDLVATTAAAADPRRRAEIELGILRARDWLQCLDPSGYQALGDYLRAHSGDPVMVDLARAANAQASLVVPAESALAAPASSASAPEASPASSAPSFSAAADVVSPSH